ncbi:MAG: Gfo/Idh/MocA family oxidoreductase [Oscillospiraceae bacterium]
MEKQITFAICGCGVRGLQAYAAYQKDHPEKMKIVAGADIDPERLASLRAQYNVPINMCFASDVEMLAQPKLADVMIIATQDRQHVQEALAALDKGYHLLLEKPISPELSECVALQKKAHEKNRIIVVCHVLRYTEFYGTLQKILREGAIGKIETLNAVESVAYWHYAHSFVRGNWRRSEETSPMILAKSCHDMDLIRWLIGEKCLRVASYGSQDYFKAKNAPNGCTKRCLDGCAVKASCPYDAEKIYIENERSGVRAVGDSWPCSVLTNHPNEETVYSALGTGPYGRCVFHSDNNVVDHQVLMMEFESNITATFTMSAFTQTCHRTISVMGTLGEIEGDLEENTLLLRRFGHADEVISIANSTNEFAGHGGGDMRMMDYLCDLLANNGEQGLTSVDASVESHIMALAAEKSRLEGGKSIDIAEFASL